MRSVRNRGYVPPYTIGKDKQAVAAGSEREGGHGYFWGVVAKKVKNIWADIVSWESLIDAWRQARKGKRYRPDVMRFAERWEENILNIHNHLIWRSWSPAPLSSFPVYEPKYRVIEAPVFKDRVVHHAVCSHLEPIFERRFIHDSYACRKNKGIHSAALRVQSFLRQARRQWGRVFVLQADIASYFPSICHYRLLHQIAKVVSDPDVLWFWETLLAGLGRSRGLPIGALTSQLAANVYLDVLDHLIKDNMGEKYYIRYMDDWLILSPDKKHLWKQLETIRDFLADDLGLSLNPKTRVYPAVQGVDFCGYRTWTTHILPRKRNISTARRRLKGMATLYKKGRIDRCQLDSSVASFLGYTKHCSSSRSVNGILNDLNERLTMP